MNGIQINVLSGEVAKITSQQIIMTPQQAYDAALERIRVGFEVEMETLHKTYPQSEREGWPMQIESARFNLSAAPSELIDAIALGRGETAAAASTRVLNKLNEYQTIYAQAVGKIGVRRADADAALLISDVDALNAIVW